MEPIVPGEAVRLLGDQTPPQPAVDAIFEDERYGSDYRVNEIFYSIQGEGRMAGTAMVFVRFADCNLRCRFEGPMRFDCDTEFSSAVGMSAADIVAKARSLAPEAEWMLLTGGEPALQVGNGTLIDRAHAMGFRVAIETNGTKPLPSGLDWVCVSPKTAFHALRPGVKVDELKLVRVAGQCLPEVGAFPFLAAAYSVSPAFQADGSLTPEDLSWCIDLVKANPAWRLSVQTHKFLRVR